MLLKEEPEGPFQPDDERQTHNEQDLTQEEQKHRSDTDKLTLGYEGNGALRRERDTIKHMMKIPVKICNETFCGIEDPIHKLINTTET